MRCRLLGIEGGGPEGGGGGSMAAVHGVAGATGRVARDRGLARTCSVSEGGRGRFASDSSMGAGGPPTAGGPEKGRVAPARSIATNYKVS